MVMDGYALLFISADFTAFPSSPFAALIYYAELYSLQERGDFDS